jgi:poly(hydroxyalkanoate) depolymerase family esterase
MNAIPDFDMMEATRLTREGRLEEAMAVIQRTLAAGRTFPGTAPDLCGMRAASAPSILDMVPSSDRTGRAWTLPQHSKVHSAPRRERTTAPQNDGSIRGLLDRMGQLSSARGLEGLVGPAVHRAPSQPLPQGARFEERTFTNEAGSRTYKVYVPSGYTGQALPLVVMLHGCTQSPDDFAAGTRMNEVAEQQTFLVAYPAQAQSANPSKCWNWFNGADQRRGRGEPSLIAGITLRIMREFSVDPRRVYVAGLSAGGAASAVMGSTYPDLYAAIGVHSGLACGAASDMPSAFAAMRQGGPLSASRSHGQRSGSAIPTIVFHGDQDRTVNSANGNQIIAQSKAAAELWTTVVRGESPGGMSYTCTVQADASGRPILEHWILHGAGHAWSGGSAAGSYTDPLGPDASREMIRFFLQHAKAAEPLN